MLAMCRNLRQDGLDQLIDVPIPLWHDITRDNLMRLTK